MARKIEGPVCLCLVLVVLALVLLLAGRRGMWGPRKPVHESMALPGAPRSGMMHLGQRPLVPVGELNATCELRPGGMCWLLNGEAGYCSRDGLYCMVPQVAA